MIVTIMLTVAITIMNEHRCDPIPQHALSLKSGGSDALTRRAARAAPKGVCDRCRAYVFEGRSYHMLLLDRCAMAGRVCIFYLKYRKLVRPWRRG